MPHAPAEPGAPAPRRRRWRRLLLGILVSATLTLVLLEVVLRLFPSPIPELRQLDNLRGFYQLDGEGRLQTTPGWRGSLTVDGRTLPAVTNDQGLRGPELPPRAPGERRILMLGDSFVWGMGVAADEAIPARLEALLRQRGIGPVRVGNAGMWGTGPREWAHTLRRHRPTFAPDLVIAVTYAGNDVGDTLAHPSTVVDGYLLDGLTAAAMQDSWRLRLGLRFRCWFYLERFVLLRFWPLRPKPPDAVLPPGLSPFEGYFYDVAPERSDEAPWLQAIDERLRQHLAAFAAEARGLPVLVVVLPGREASAAQRYQERLAAMPVPDGLLVRGAGPARLTALVQQQGLDVLDLTPRIFGLPDPDAIYLSDYHYNPAGCDLVAGWLLPEVLARLKP